MEHTYHRSATASETGAVLYIAPYTGWRSASTSATEAASAVHLRRLSKHAASYREISLLLRRPPRAARPFPGDVFYLHSAFLERAAKLSDKKGGGSLTAIPIIETQAGDVSAYQPDERHLDHDGQIFLESDLFNSGIRPPSTSAISVSRVGGSAQTKKP